LLRFKIDDILYQGLKNPGFYEKHAAFHSFLLAKQPSL